MNDFEAYLTRLVQQTVTSSSVGDALNYSLIECKGKRLRPLIAISTAKALQANDDGVYDLASALEAMHTYSLIHDDLPCMDNDDLRRGNLTCHKKFNEEIALLAGDALNTLAFYWISASCKLDDQQKANATLVLSYNAGINGMVKGQCIDLESEDKAIDYDTLKQLHYLKTGCLLSVAFQFGAIGAKRYDLCERFDTIGLQTGLAFQIQDDILDVTQSQEVLGKSNSDIQNHKATSVSLLGLDKATMLMNELYNKVLNSLLEMGIEKTSELYQLIENMSQRNH